MKNSQETFFFPEVKYLDARIFTGKEHDKQFTIWTLVLTSVKIPSAEWADIPVANVLLRLIDSHQPNLMLLIYALTRK